MESDLKFEYNNEQSEDENFDRWLRWTNREHRAYNEPEYTRQQGLIVFKKIYKSTWHYGIYGLLVY